MIQVTNPGFFQTITSGYSKKINTKASGQIKYDSFISFNGQIQQSETESVMQNKTNLIASNLSNILYKNRSAGIKLISFGLNTNAAMADEVSRVLFNHRRSINTKEPSEALKVFSSIWQDKLKPYIEANKPIEMMIAAFPFKSLSRLKCASEHADMAEISCIQYLNQVLDDIKSVYPSGGKLHIFSDGYIFSGIEGNPSNEIASLYAQELKEIVKQHGNPDSIKLITLSDLFDNNVDTARENIFKDHGQSIETIRERIKADTILCNDFCGIKRFVYEELRGIPKYSELSKNKADELAKKLAYQTVQASEAWTTFLKFKMPISIRLSCHPQNYDSPSKIGIYLGKGKDNWLTPWMGVAVKVDDKYILAQNSQAQNLGLKLIYNDKGYPSHYEVPEGINIDELFIKS